MTDTYIIIMDTNVLGEYSSEKKSVIDCIKNREIQLNENNLVCNNFKYFSVSKSCFLELIKYIQQEPLLHNVKIAIPQIVIDELREQQVSKFETLSMKLDEKFYKFSEIEGFKLTKPSSFDYNQFLNNTISSFMNKYSLLLINYPTNDVLPKLINKVIKRHKPFYKKSNKGVDSGFKDAILWESLIKYAKDNPNHKLILFTRDPDFVDNNEKLLGEFKSETGNQILIKKNLADLKSFISEVMTNNVEYKHLIRLYALNYNFIYSILHKYFKSPFDYQKELNIIDFKLSLEIKDIKILSGSKSIIIVPVTIFLESSFSKYSGSFMQFIYPPDELVDYAKISLKKEGDKYKIVEITFESATIISSETISEELPFSYD